MVRTGNGGVPAAYGWNYAGSRADSDRRADVIVVNQGANDAAFGSAEFRAACRACPTRLRAAAPHARILALRPFDGSHATDIGAVGDELADGRVEFVEATGWLDAAQGDFNGTVHPSAQGHRTVADRPTGLISAQHRETQQQKPRNPATEPRNPATTPRILEAVPERSTLT